MKNSSLDTEIFLLLRSIEAGLRKADLPETVSKYLDEIYNECTSITMSTLTESVLQRHISYHA